MLKASGSMGNASIKLGIYFSKIGLSPNAWTVLALLPAFFGFLALAYNQLLAGAVLFILSGLIDAVDGAVARVTGAVTNLGAFLDGIIDRYVEMLLYLGLLIFLQNNYVPELLIPHIYWIAILIFGALMPTFVRAYADHRNVVTDPREHRLMGGLVERAERMVLILLAMLLGYFNTAFLIYLIAVTAVLSHFTALQRILYVVRVAKKK
jgi:phosphatidylglycerophosphate synthase